MKITYKNCPILKSLYSKKLDGMVCHQDDLDFFDEHGDDFKDTFIKNSDFFKSDINVISKPFFEAANNARQKLRLLFIDILENNIDDIKFSGTYIYGNNVYLINHIYDSKSEKLDVVFFLFYKEQPCPLVFFKYNSDGIICWVSKILEINANSKTDIKQAAYLWVNSVVQLYMFKSYASVETKILNSHTIKKEIGCIYRNDTNFNLTYLDSKWFTNLVKSEGFKVRGHFRLQPKIINGKWTKELIWISDFEKSGYTSKAKILSA